MSVVDAGKYIKNHCYLAGTVTLPYDENGDFRWGEEYDSDTADVLNGSSGMVNIDGYKTGVPTYNHMDTDGTPDGTDFAVITVNNNTVTMEVYSFK